MVDVDAEGRPIQPVDTGVKCEKCGSPMAVRKGPRGPFLGCTAYPKCRSLKPLSAELRRLCEHPMTDVSPPGWASRRAFLAGALAAAGAAFLDPRQLASARAQAALLPAGNLFPLGVASALWRNSWLDHALRVVTVSGLAIASFQEQL